MKKYRFKTAPALSDRLNVDGHSYLFKPFPKEYPLNDFLKKALFLYPNRFEEILTMKVVVEAPVEKAEVLIEIKDEELIVSPIVDEVIEEVVETPIFKIEDFEEPIVEEELEEEYKYNFESLDKLNWRKLKKIALKEDIDYTEKDEVIAKLIKIIKE